MNLSTNTILIILSILGILNITLFVVIIKINSKIKKFLINIDSTNISDSLQYLSNTQKDLQKFQSETNEQIKQIEHRLKKSIQSVHTIRFNPFQGTGEGGNQSFATTFLNENGDGAVISSLYTRDRVSVFSKSLNNFGSDYEMSDEEKDSIKKAKEKLNI